MITIAERARLTEFVSLYQEHAIAVDLVSLGHGTANSDVLRRFGLERTEKTVIFSVVTDSTWKAVKKGLERKIRIDVPGTGIAFLVPMSSVGGRRELALLTENQRFEQEEESEMKGTERELLVVIANRGYSHLVMEAANDAGATGGTVIHARGTGVRQEEQFLGISLASEKSVILIVTRTENKNTIMQSVMKKAGRDSDAQAIVFSLPVTDTAGLRLLEELEEEPAGEAAPEQPDSE